MPYTAYPLLMVVIDRRHLAPQSGLASSPSRKRMARLFSRCWTCISGFLNRNHQRPSSSPWLLLTGASPQWRPSHSLAQQDRLLLNPSRDTLHRHSFKCARRQSFASTKRRRRRSRCQKITSATSWRSILTTSSTLFLRRCGEFAHLDLREERRPGTDMQQNPQSFRSWPTCRLGQVRIAHQPEDPPQDRKSTRL